MATEYGLDGKLLEDMTIGNTVDYIIESFEMHNPENKKNKDTTRIATQKDFDNF